ncbi:MAG: phosphatidate cytidylyltransferase [Gemmatimonadales bacterium]
MSELGKRTAFAVVAVPAVVWLVWLGGAPLAILISAASAIAAHEFYRLGIAAGNRPLLVHGVMLSAAVPLFVYARHLGYWVPEVGLVMLVVLYLFAVTLWLRGPAGKPLEAVAITLLGVFYTGGMMSFAFALRYHAYAIGAAAGTAVLMFPFLLTWATDIGGYAFGRMIGGRKLMPSVSPGKTVAGGVGGLVLAIVIALVYERFALRPLGQLGMLLQGTILFAILVSVADQVGDLVESMLKRQAGVKDSSHLIPGHGGMLDRIDSLLFTLPVSYALLSWLLVPVPR